MEKREYGPVDVVKFICAVIVVAGHCYLADVEGFFWYTRLVVLAVQIFFIFSGYFLVAAGTLHREAKSVSYVKHLLGMTVIWLVPYFILNLLITDRTSAVWVYDFTALWTEFFSSFNSGHLWYLQNLLVVVVLLLAVKKTDFSEKELFILLIAASVFYGRFTRALLGVAAGMFLAHTGRPDAGSPRRNACGKLLMGSGIIMAAGSALWIFTGNSAAAEIMANYIGNVCSILLAYAALRAGGNVRNTKTQPKSGAKSSSEPKCAGGINFVYLRKQSTLIYLVHLLFVPIVVRLMGIFLPQSLRGEQGLAWCLVLTGLVLLCSVAFGAIVIRLSKTSKFAWLKHLY